MLVNLAADALFVGFIVFGLRGLYANFVLRR